MGASKPAEILEGAQIAIARGDAAAMSKLLDECGRLLDDPALSGSQDPEDLSQLLTLCGQLLMERFRATSSRDDIDRSIEMSRAAVDVEPERAILRHNLSATLRERYGAYGSAGDLESAGESSHQAIQLANEGEDIGMYLSGLISNLFYEHESQPREEIVQEAGVAATAMVQATPPDHPRVPERISRLASVWQLSFEYSGDVAELRKSLDLEERIKEVSPRYMNNLAVTSLLLYRQLGESEDLERAVDFARSAVDASPPGESVHGSRVATLGGALFARYEETGEVASLEEALKVTTAALASPGGAPTKYARRLRRVRESCLSELAELDPEDWVIEELRKELSAGTLADSSDDVAPPLDEIEARVEGDRVANAEGLDGAVEEAERKVDAQPLKAPGRFRYLKRLGNALTARYEGRGSISDLSRAIAVLEEAVAAIPESASERRHLLTALSSALMRRNEHRQDDDDLDRAVGLAEEVHARVRTISGKAQAAGNLSFLLARRAVKKKSLDDAQRAVEMIEATATATPRSSPAWASRSNNFGNALYALWRVNRDPRALESLVAVRREVAAATPREGLHFPVAHRNLGVTYRDLHVASGEMRWLEASRQAFRQCYEVAVEREVSEALAAAQGLADWALEREEWGDARLWYSRCLDAVERLIVSQLARTDQFSWLRDVQGIAAKAALACARDGDGHAAARELERGRLLTLDPRGSLVVTAQARLRSAGKEEEAARLERAFGAWSRLGQAADSIPEEPGRELAELLASAERARSDLDALLEEARELVDVPSVPGAGELPTLAGCPLVYLSPLGSGTLVVAVFPDGAVSFTELSVTSSEIGTKVVRLANSRMDRGSRSFKKTLRDIGSWQWESLVDPVLEHLGEPGEVVLVPTGLSALLPLGIGFESHPDLPGGRRYLGERVVARIAPSGRAARASEEIGAQRTASGTLVVTDPRPSPLPPLRYSRLEAAAVQVGSGQVTLLSGVEATPEKVKETLASHDVLHFICHAEANRGAPLSSALMLGGGKLTVGELLFARTQGSRLAILSACDTAVAGVEVPDEVVALPTALLAIGCAGVIASFWQVGDLPTSLLIARFYECWIAEGMPPPAALPAAQLWLRSQTARELRSFVSSLESRMPGDERGSLRPARRALRLMRSRSRPFADPVNWAAFAYFGA